LGALDPLPLDVEAALDNVPLGLRDESQRIEELHLFVFLLNALEFFLLEDEQVVQASKGELVAVLAFLLPLLFAFLAFLLCCLSFLFSLGFSQGALLFLKDLPFQVEDLQGDSIPLVGDEGTVSLLLQDPDLLLQQRDSGVGHHWDTSPKENTNEG